MPRTAPALLALCAACSVPLDVRADAPQEAALLQRFQVANDVSARRARDAVNAAIDEAKQHEKQSPDQTLRLLRALQHRVEHDPAAPRVERRKLTALIQQQIDGTIERSLLKLPRTTDNVLREYRDPDNNDSPSGLQRAKLHAAEAKLLFSNGLQLDGLVHSVGQGVRCTLQGQRLVIPGWLVPAIHVHQGCYFFDYTLRGYKYSTREECALSQKAWHASRIGLGLTHGAASTLPIWDAIADRFTAHGDHLIALWRHDRPKDEVCGCVEKNMPELVWACRNAKLEREIGELLPGCCRKTKRNVGSLIAGYADSRHWQHSKADALALLLPRIRDAVADVSIMHEERVAEFILEKAEQELQRRPL